MRYLMICLLLTGCSLIAPSHEARVTEYEVGGIYGLLTGEAAGIRIINEGRITGCLKYNTEAVAYQSPECAK